MEYVKTFSEIRLTDLPQVGGKNASLGEMFSQLTTAGINVPDGFATTAEAFHEYIRHNNLEDIIDERMDALDHEDLQALAATGTFLRQQIINGHMPEQLKSEISVAYTSLCGDRKNLEVAVRSSATAEDLPQASFAGQQETYLNISGTSNLIHSCKRVFASLFTDRAIAYRRHQGFSHRNVALSIGVQRMVRSDLASSGVMFSIDTESGFENVVFITSAYGLGENVVQGSVNPDEFYVYKNTLNETTRPIIKRQLGTKMIKMIYAGDTIAGMSTRNVSVREEERHRFSISDDEVLQLARYAIAIEKHYGRPMDIEWAKDGNDGQLYIVQARPETVQANRDKNQLRTYELSGRSRLLVTGKSVGKKIASGNARVILEAAHMNDLKPGEVLITDITDPDWEPVMKLASAIVTNRGGRTCHAAIIARELGIPAVVGCGDATQAVATGTEVTVSCAEGETGYIFEGALPYEINEIQVDEIPETKTRIMLNLGNPEKAFEASMLPADGVGLARLEFIINKSIRIHPEALLKPHRMSVEETGIVDKITAGYENYRTFFINRLSEGVGTIAAAFYPRPVIVRLSDFKSNEYAALIGGSYFEPDEENPMIGFRGASRYFSETFADCFEMECAALKNVRETMGLTNVALMIPFVRTTEEAQKTLEIMKKFGLERGVNDLKIYLMCEIPANALLAEDFLQYFDGFSIGSNDLTQLSLGIDRDTSMVSGFDERNPAVKKLMAMAIAACRAQDKYVGICGQAPSDYPEITQWLVKQGISSLSLNLDSLISMKQEVANTEAGI